MSLHTAVRERLRASLMPARTDGQDPVPPVRGSVRRPLETVVCTALPWATAVVLAVGPHWTSEQIIALEVAVITTMAASRRGGAATHTGLVADSPRPADGGAPNA